MFRSRWPLLCQASCVKHEIINLVGLFTSLLFMTLTEKNVFVECMCNMKFSEEGS